MHTSVTEETPTSAYHRRFSALESQIPASYSTSTSAMTYERSYDGRGFAPTLKLTGVLDPKKPLLSSAPAASKWADTPLWARPAFFLLIVSHRPRPFLFLFLGALLLLLVEVAFRIIPIASVSAQFATLTNPYKAAGYLDFNSSRPFETNWIPFDTPTMKWGTVPNWHKLFRMAGNFAYPADPSWNVATPGFGFDPYPNPRVTPLESYDGQTAATLRQASLESIAHLRNTTILLLGDSVDRNALDQFGWLFQTKVRQDSFNGSTFDPSSVKSWGYPHILQVGGDINLTIANGFFYGSADEVDTFKTAPDWLPPGRAEERMTELFKRLTDRLPFPPSLIQLHSGMWDLAYYGREDKLAGVDTNTLFDDERVARYEARLVSVIQKVKATWPGVPIVFRKLHRVGTTRASDDWQSDGKTVNYFPDIRIQQLRSIEDLVAAREGIAVWDFGKIFEGFQQYQEKVHPKLYPGAIIMWNGLMHNAYLAKHQRDYNLPAIDRRSELSDGLFDANFAMMGLIGRSKVAQAAAKAWSKRKRSVRRDMDEMEHASKR